MNGTHAFLVKMFVRMLTVVSGDVVFRSTRSNRRIIITKHSH